MLTLSLAACTLGPDYQRPDLPVASEFKQAEGWKPPRRPMRCNGASGGGCTAMPNSMRWWRG